jgi:exodeoxyribonuclease VII small subunit
MASKKEQPAQTFDFEAAMSELEQLVERMERGDLTLEQSLEDFERGIALFRSCEQALKAAEQKVRILTEQDGEETLPPFETEE